MTTSAPFQPAMLHVGDPVPGFEADSQLGRVKLHEYRGQWVVLFSYPADFTPVCASEVVAFGHVQNQLKNLNCALLGLSTDSVGTHRPWLQSMEDWMREVVKYPLIGDFDGRIARQLGLIMPHLHSTQAARCTFIIDPEQVLQAIMVYPPRVGRSTEEVVRLVKALQVTYGQEKATPADWQPGHEAPTWSAPVKTRQEPVLPCVW